MAAATAVRVVHVPAGDLRHLCLIFRPQTWPWISGWKISLIPTRAWRGCWAQVWFMLMSTTRVFVLCVCLICLAYMSALCVCLICLGAGLIHIDVNHEGDVEDAVLQYLDGVSLCFCRAVYVWVGVCVGQCL